MSVSFPISHQSIKFYLIVGARLCGADILLRLGSEPNGSDCSFHVRRIDVRGCIECGDVFHAFRYIVEHS